MAASLHPQNRSPYPRRATPRSVRAAAQHLWTALILLCPLAAQAGSPKDAQISQGSTPSTQLNPHKTFNLSLFKSGTAPNTGKSFSTSAAPNSLTPKFEAKSNTTFAPRASFILSASGNTSRRCRALLSSRAPHLGSVPSSINASRAASVNLTIGVVSTLVRGDTFAWGQIMAGALLAALPPVVVYAFLMDYYIAGLTAGATKG